jgi:hypothetical protein
VTGTTPLPTLTLSRQLAVLRDEIERIRIQVTQLCQSVDTPEQAASAELREQLQRAIAFLEDAADHLMPDPELERQAAAPL